MNDRTNPRLVTTGVTPPEEKTPHTLRAGLDWLQYSVEWPPQLSKWPDNNNALLTVLRSALPPVDKISLTGELIRPMPGYNGAMGATHARMFWHSENRWQNIGVVMTGDDMRSVLSIPFPHEALLRWCVAKSKKIARLDFALDVHDVTANPRDIMTAWKGKSATTPAQKVMEFTSYEKTTDGTILAAPTVYVGARQSDRQLRIYDKARQMGLDTPWVRIELQLRDQRAWALAQAMVRHGIARAGQQAIRDYITVPEVRWWLDAVSGEAVYIEPVGKKETNTEKWIREVCLPAIRKVAAEQIEQGRWTLYDQVYDVLGDLLRTYPTDGKG